MEMNAANLEDVLRMVSQEASVWGYKSGLALSRVTEYNFRIEMAANAVAHYKKGAYQSFFGAGFAIVAAILIAVFASSPLVGVVYLLYVGMGYYLHSLVQCYLYIKHHSKEKELYETFIKEWKDIQERDKLASSPEDLMKYSTNAVQVMTVPVPEQEPAPQEETHDPEFDEALRRLLEGNGNG